MCFFRQSSQEKKIYDEILHLKAEQQGISMTDNFAAYSKLQRRIIKLEDLHKENTQARRSANIKIKLFVTYGLQIILGFTMFVTAYWFRHTPLFVLDQSLFPFQRLFSYPNDFANSISPHSWIIISRVSFSSVMQGIS